MNQHILNQLMASGIFKGQAPNEQMGMAGALGAFPKDNLQDFLDQMLQAQYADPEANLQQENAAMPPSQAQAAPNPYDALLQQIITSNPDIAAQDIFDEKYKIKGKTGFLKALAEGMSALAQGPNYVDRKTRSKQEAKEEQARMFEMVLNAKKAQDAGQNIQTLGTSRMMNADAAQQRAATARFSAQSLDAYRNKMAEIDNRRAAGQIDHWQAMKEKSKAQEELYQSRAALTDAQTEQTMVKTQNLMDTSGLGGAFGAALKASKMKPEDAKKFMDTHFQVQRGIKESKYPPGMFGDAASGGRLMQRLDPNAQYWDAVTQQIVNIPTGIMWRQRSGQAYGVGPVGFTKLDQNSRRALSMGKAASGTATTMLANIADAIVTGQTDKFMGVFEQNKMARTLRRWGVRGELGVDEAFFNFQAPTAMLQHLSQLTGGLASDKKMEHFFNSIALEKISDPYALLHNALVFRLATEHNNNLIANVEVPAHATPKLFAEIKQAVTDYVGKLKVIAQENKRRAAKGLPRLFAPSAPQMSDFLTYATPNERSNEFSFRPLGSPENPTGR